MSKYWILVCGLLCAGCLSFTPQIEALSEDEITAFFAELTAETNALNAAFYEDVFVSGYRHLHTDARGHRHDFSQPVDKFVEKVEVFYDTLSEMDYRVEILSVQIDEEATAAEVEVDITERYLKHGKWVERSSYATYYLRLVDGEIKVELITT